MKHKEIKKARNTAKYKHMRDKFLMDNPLCKHCESKGIIEGATDLDHIQPVIDGGEFWDEDNLQALCRDCHKIKTQAESKARYLARRNDETYNELTE